MLGFVSLFMDLSSELIHSLLPIWMVSTLGATALTVGIVEGISEATALLVKVFSGAVSDFFGRRKLPILIGYGLAAFTKPLFPLAASIETVFVARFLDRVGKGIRGAPRDALIADVAPAEIRGACFGLRQSMDTIGAFIGPLVAVLLLILFEDRIEPVLWVAVLPAAVAVLVIVFGIDEPSYDSTKPTFHSPLNFDALKQFDSQYGWIVLLGAMFTLARFSEAFLVLRAQQVGIGVTWLPLIMVLMSFVYALSAYPVGIVSDRIDKSNLLMVGLGFLMVADILLAQTESVSSLLFAMALWGCHMGFSQGILATMVAENAPAGLKGIAFGFFNFVSGFFMLIASVLAGWLWDRWGAEWTFYGGASFAAIAAVMLWLGPFKFKGYIR